MWQLSPRQEVTEKSFTLLFYYLLGSTATKYPCHKLENEGKNYFVFKEPNIALLYRKTDCICISREKLLKVTELPMKINEKAFHIVCSNRHVLALWGNWEWRLLSPQGTTINWANSLTFAEFVLFPPQIVRSLAFIELGFHCQMVNLA